MADAVVGVVVQKLDSLMQREFGLVWGVEQDVTKLSSVLSTIQAVLEDAEIKQFVDKPIANWLFKLKDAARFAEDILDEWLATDYTNTHNVGNSSLPTCLSFSQCKFRRSIAKNIKTIIARLDEIAEERLKFHLNPGVVVQHSGFQLDESRETSSFLTEKVVYGRDGDRDKIIDVMLTNVSRDENVSILSIVGIGGLGKTTLAQLVYQHNRVIEHFDSRIWVCVTQDFEAKKIIKLILESLTGGACDLESLDPLQRLLQQKVNGKKFLLVLDDVWNEEPEKWRRLNTSLSCGARGSWILVTTRLEAVASIMSPFLAHRLTFLSEEECWSLFRGHAFGAEKEETANLVEIGKQIVKKCGGVPLAAKALGGLMFSKRQVEEWLHVRDSRIWDLPQVEEGGILPSLRLSYIHMPLHLKQCFAFCSIYLKASMLYRYDLTLHWMANGFVQSDGRKEPEEIGNLIFDELLRRGFFHEPNVDDVGGIISCKMHDLMHDLASSVSLNECSNIKVGKSDTIPKGTRHCSLIFDLPTDVESKNLKSLLKPNPVLRTLTLEGFCTRFKPPQILFKNLDCLRTLDLGCTGIQMLPNSIGKMKHLRFLDLFGSNIKSLPESICNLRNLQFLGLRDCEKLQQLPEDIGKVTSLRHLRIKRCKSLTKMPIGIGKLMHLQTLSMFIVGPENGKGINELQHLNALRGEVKIKGLEHVRNSKEAKEANLPRKKNLTSLGLYWSVEDEKGVANELQERVVEALEPHDTLKVLLIHEYRGRKLPSWIGLLTNLVKIKLKGCDHCESLPPLGQLVFLKDLYIRGFDSVKCVGNDFFAGGEGEGVFPSLHKLVISLWNLEEWSYSPSSDSAEEIPRHIFPCLKDLFIYNCPKLASFPFSPSVEDLSLQKCNGLILRSLDKLLPCLHSLQIGYFEELTSFPEGIFTNSTGLQELVINDCYKLKSLPEEIRNLSALKELQILGCKELVTLPVGLQNLTSLENMMIMRCDSLISVSVGLQCLTSLNYLEITACPKLEFSMGDFQHLTSLVYLAFEEMPQLTTLPDGIQHLTTLQELYIEECKNLIMLPECLQHLKSFVYLRIRDCNPELHRRCNRDKGEDWHKISHIPELDIYTTTEEEPSTSTGCSSLGLFNKLSRTR